MAVQEKLLTAEDLWALPNSNDKRIELARGILVEMPGSGGENTIIAGQMTRFLGNFVYERDLGYVTPADGTFILFRNPDTVRIPDVAYISKARLPEIPKGYIPLAPDLAVEGVSPGDSASEIREKILEYFAAGTRLVWVVYPRLKSVDVYTAVDKLHIVTIDQELDGGEVLPGFKLPLHDLFKNIS